MSYFLKVMTAKLDPATQVMEGLWGIQRGWKDQPHRAACCIAHAGPEGVKRVLATVLYADLPSDMNFEAFVRMLHKLHRVPSAATVAKDAYTHDVLRRNGITPRYNGKPDIIYTDEGVASGNDRTVELLLGPAMPKADLPDWKELLAAVAFTALQQHDDLAWV